MQNYTVGKKLKESNGGHANVPDGSHAGGNRDVKVFLYLVSSTGTIL